ncbi:MAG: glucose-6-phosphate dehydrogenase [Rectinema sp.]
MNIADDSPYCRLDTTRFSPEPALFFVFGASGDLASRKIFPALYDLYLEKQLPVGLLMIGAARRDYSTEQFREIMRTSCMAHSRHKAEALHDEAWHDFSQRIFYLRNDVEDTGSYATIRKLVVERDRSVLAGLGPGAELPENTLYYLAVTPEFFPVIAENLGRSGCGSDTSSQGWRRLVVEKPYGKDQQSAARLTESLHRWFEERDIYRIDHYLGKEAVQNLLHFRFANTIFEPVWNRNYIDRIEITVVEQEGIGTRGGYYDGFGAARDMLQNHLTQLLCLTVMEPPASLSPEHIRDEKVKVLRAIPEYSKEQILARARRGQYMAGTDAQGRAVPDYRAEHKVRPDSATETYASLTLSVENWRFSDVPITLRTGKALAEKYSEIVLYFKRPPSALFAALCGDRLATNSLTVRIQPDEGIWLSFNAKVPGEPAIRSNSLRFSYREVTDYFPEAYERLILDALSGDSTLFIRADESELAWKVIDRLEAAWASVESGSNPEEGGLLRYSAGTSLKALRHQIEESPRLEGIS